MSGKPRIMLEVDIFSSKKVAELPWRRQLGWIFTLCRAKEQDREGLFASLAVLKVEAGVFRDGVADWLAAKLLHDAAALCDKCVVAWAGIPDGSVVVHDWSQYQVSRTTSWRLDKALAETPNGTVVKQPGNNGETVVEHPSRAGVTRFPVPSSETSSTTEGVQGEPEPDIAVFVAMARAGAAIRPESGMGQRVVRLVARRGAEAVLAELARLTTGGPLSDRQIVFGLEDALDKIPVAADNRAAEAAAERDKRAVLVQEKAAAKRLAWFAQTGQWDPNLGPEPEWNEAEWGKRPGAAA